MKLSNMFFNVIYILQFYPCDEFLVSEMRKSCMEIGLESIERASLAQICVLQNPA